MLTRRLTGFGFCGAVVLLFLVVGCGEPRGSGVFQKAHEQLSAGNLVVAKTMLERYVRANPGSPQIARAYNDLGVIDYRLGKSADAVGALEKSLGVDGSFAPAAYNRGVLAIQAGDLENGKNYLLHAANAAGSDARALLYAAFAQGRERDWGGAEVLLRQARERDPSSAEILTSLACAQIHVAGPDAARGTLDAALDVDPRYAPALFNLGVLHALWRGDLMNGVGYLEEYLEFGGDDTHASQAMDLLVDLRVKLEEILVKEGAALLKKGEVEKALRAFQGAVAQREDSLGGHLGIAEAAMRFSPSEAVGVALERALEIDPENREAMWGIAVFFDQADDNAAAAIRQYQEFIREYPGDARTHAARERISVLSMARRE